MLRLAKVSGLKMSALQNVLLLCIFMFNITTKKQAMLNQLYAYITGFIWKEMFGSDTPPDCSFIVWSL